MTDKPTKMPPDVNPERAILKNHLREKFNNNFSIVTSPSSDSIPLNLPQSNNQSVNNNEVNKGSSVTTAITSPKQSALTTEPASSFSSSNKKQYFDYSPRSSFSRSYSASNLRISRTNNLLFSNGNYSNAVIDTSSDDTSEDDDDDRATMYVDEENSRNRAKFNGINSNSKNNNNNNPNNRYGNTSFLSNQQQSVSSSSAFSSRRNSLSGPVTGSTSLSAMSNINQNSPLQLPPSTTQQQLFDFNFDQTVSVSHLHDDEMQPISPLPTSQQQQQQQQPQGNPNIFFKKIINKKKLTPKLKSFKRIINDLQNEFHPLDVEIQHESIITNALKVEDDILNSKLATSLLSHHNNNSNNSIQNRVDSLKKFEIINKANESWNHNRRLSNHTIASVNSNHTPNTINNSTNLDELNDLPNVSNNYNNNKNNDNNNEKVQSQGKCKRKATDDPIQSQSQQQLQQQLPNSYYNNKRRIVSVASTSSECNSPNLDCSPMPLSSLQSMNSINHLFSNNGQGIGSNGANSNGSNNNSQVPIVSNEDTTTTAGNVSASFSGSNSKLIQRTSDDLEMMSLK